MRPFLLVGVVVFAAGCLGDDGIHIVASRPLLMTSYAYDGRNLSNATGTLEIRLDAGKNTGSVRASAADAFHNYEVEWRSFAGRVPWQSGGVAADLDMWGNSANGSSVFPRIRVYVAAFGEAESRVDGRAEKDPSDLGPRLDAVLFVTQGRIRDNESHRIEDRDKLGAYDPADPEDAYVGRIGSQAILLLFTQRGELLRHFDYQDVQIRSR